MFNEMLTHADLASKYSLYIAPFFALLVVGTVLPSVFKFKFRWKK